jgi:hypothetical protein
VFAISASKATPTAISERVNSALLVDCTSVAESKSTAFGALASTVIVFALLALQTPLIQILNLLKWY